MIPTTLRLKSAQKQNFDQGNDFDPDQKIKLPESLRRKEKKTKYDFEGENDLDREIERNIAQGTSRIAETVLGLPGDLYSFTKRIFGFDPETNLPTSQKLREFSEKASLGYTKPQGEFEEKAGEVLQDMASFMIPGSGQYNMLRNIGIPVISNLAQEGLKYSGNEKIGNAVKSGLMIGLDLMTHKGKGAKNYASSLFNESETIIPKGEKLYSPKFEKSLSNLEKTLSSGGSSPSKEKSLKKIGEIQSKIKNGEIEVKELVDFRKTINEIKSELGGYEVQLPKHIKKKAIANLDLVKGKVIDALEEYGTKSNPEFGKLNRAANESYAAYENSDKMANFIKKSVGNTVRSSAVKTLFGLSGLGAAAAYPALAAKGAVVAAPAYLGYEAYKIFSQVMNSPTLRKFYGNVLKGAAVGNASQVSKNIKALENNIEEE
jgi:hypothetical protein